MTVHGFVFFNFTMVNGRPYLQDYFIGTWSIQSAPKDPETIATWTHEFTQSRSDNKRSTCTAKFHVYFKGCNPHWHLSSRIYTWMTLMIVHKTISYIPWYLVTCYSHRALIPWIKAPTVCTEPILIPCILIPSVISCPLLRITEIPIEWH